VSTQLSSSDRSPPPEGSRSSLPPRIDHLGTRALRPVLIAVAVVTVIAGWLLLKDLTKLGLWDPHELALADQGCRRAAATGKIDLSSCGVDAGSKSTDLRPIVMVQSVAMGFRLFGVSEYAGRLPLALWALAGAIAITVAVGRLIDARAGLFTGVVLATMPTFLVQGRLILGDAATMGAFALALAGLAVAAFDREADGSPTPWPSRIPWAVIGAIGVAAGIGCRGLAVGTAPALAVGLAWLVRVANIDRASDARAPLHTLVAAAVVAGGVALGIKLAPIEIGESILRAWTGRSLAIAALVGAGVLGSLRGTAGERGERAIVGAALAVGAVGVAEGSAVALMSEDGRFVAAVGALASGTRKFPTFDLHVRQIAHALFPWSCFLPFALGRVLARPAVDETDRGATRREVDLRVAALLAAAICYFAQTIAAPRFGLLPFAAPVAVAIVIALVLRDLERVPSASLAIAIGTAVFAFLVINDFTFEDLAKTPVELATAPVIEPYGLYGVVAPEELRLKLKLALAIAAGVFLLPIFFVWVDENPVPGWTRRESLRKPIDAVIAAWRHPWHGLLILLFLSFEACFAIAGILTWKRRLRRAIPQLQALSGQQRDLVVNLWWLVLVGVIAIYAAWVAFLYGRDAFRQLRRQRVATIAIGGLVAAGVWAWGVMPAVANQFSPKGVFAKYREIGGGAPIGLLGVNARTAAYDLGNAQPVVHNDARSAYDWLAAAGAERRFLAIRAENLAELNHLWRQKADPKSNLPILDGRTSQILLASNLTSNGYTENPLNRMVLDGIPTATTNCEDPSGPICNPSRALTCDIDGKLACVGWDLMDTNGKPIGSVSSGQRVKLRLIYRVTNRVSGGWQIFIHVEQPGTATARKTWDHVPLQGKYPMDNWLPGDVIVDDSEFSLEPNMPAGRSITILTGFFSGNTRLPLVSGPDAGPEQEGLRLVLGSVPVR
jgi:4-amino-4-deoxy-L-arabinose transferase-like glycosyltransferase